MTHPTYTTDDAAVVTVLNLHGLHPHTVDTEGRKVLFRFERTAYLTEVLDNYDRGALQVSAKMFALLYRDCVTRMKHQQRAAGGQ
jgi:hypothetical protein